MSAKRLLLQPLALWITVSALAQQSDPPTGYLLAPARVFDGHEIHEGWQVWTRADTIVAAGPNLRPGPAAERVDLPNTTLLPGLIEGHSHILLHPYDETSWTDQVLKESVAERAARATMHAKASIDAGWLTLRDLGSEGIGYADVGIRQAIEKGAIPGPRLLVAGPAIVATGAYGPKGFREGVNVPLGAEEADGANLVTVVRRQVGGGADWIKFYADARIGPFGQVVPSFSESEMRMIVETAGGTGRDVAAHAYTPEAMSRAIEAGVRTIEHGDQGTPAVWREMVAAGVWLCPTVAAGDAVERYGGWDGSAPYPARVAQKRETVKAALAAGVKICVGSDVGVFTHGTQARELELLVAAGMTPVEVLRAATAGNAEMLRLENTIGSVAPGMQADLIAVTGDPINDIAVMRKVAWVMQAGRVIN